MPPSYHDYSYGHSNLGYTPGYTIYAGTSDTMYPPDRFNAVAQKLSVIGPVEQYNESSIGTHV